MRPYEFKDRVHLQVSYEFDLTLHRIDRDVYSILDWIGDVGGLNEGLFLFFSVILAYFQYFDFENFLVDRLFRQYQPRNWATEKYHKYEKRDGTEFKRGQQNFNEKETSWISQRCNTHCKCWCRLNRQERLYGKARNRLYEEIDIVNFIKKIRRYEEFRGKVSKALDLTQTNQRRDKQDSDAFMHLVESCDSDENDQQN